MKSPQEVVDLMYQRDDFSRWMGITIDEVSLGSCRLSMIVKQEMLNGHQTLHGGVSYSFADSALGFASNSHGIQCVSIESTISHIRPVQINDQLTAIASEIHRGKTIGLYEVLVLNQHQKKIAHFKGTVHISGREW